MRFKNGKSSANIPLGVADRKKNAKNAEKTRLAISYFLQGKTQLFGEKPPPQQISDLIKLLRQPLASAEQILTLCVFSLFATLAFVGWRSLFGQQPRAPSPPIESTGSTSPIAPGPSRQVIRIPIDTAPAVNDGRGDERVRLRVVVVWHAVVQPKESMTSATATATATALVRCIRNPKTAIPGLGRSP